MIFSFDKIHGPRQSRRENFEELISQLLALELNASSVDGSGGDGGIDCFVRSEDRTLVIIQAKYFTSRLTTSQRRQISRSLETARLNHKLSRWILCIPIDPTPSERSWFDSLIQDDSILEWWGAIRIRTLLAKYPEIAKAFFPDESSAVEFRAFRQKIEETLVGLATSHWYSGRQDSDSVVRKYLARAKIIGALLVQDAPLLQKHELVYVGLDFTELYTYMSCDSRFVGSTPVVDFYIQNSPYSLYLLPGAAMELTKFMNFAVPRNFDHYAEELKREDNPLQSFLNNFESNPSSEDTHKAYNFALDYLRDLNVPPAFNVRKLRSALETGTVQSSPSDIPFISDNNDLGAVFQRLSDKRPRRTLSNMTDALNLTFLKSYTEKTGLPVRMITSDRALAGASKEYLGDTSFVRSSSEFAVLIHSARSGQAQNPESMELEAQGLILAANELDERLRTMIDPDELLTTDENQLRAVISSFEAFAPFYRKMLRPVDDMIESGLLALPTTYSPSMLELYRILKRESELVASFKSWWDDMSRELVWVTELLRSRYISEQTITSIESLER